MLADIPPDAVVAFPVYETTLGVGDFDAIQQVSLEDANRSVRYPGIYLIPNSNITEPLPSSKIVVLDRGDHLNFDVAEHKHNFRMSVSGIECRMLCGWVEDGAYYLR